MKLINKIKNLFGKKTVRKENESEVKQSNTSSADSQDTNITNASNADAMNAPEEIETSEDIKTSEENDFDIEMMKLDERIDFEVEMAKTNPNHEPIRLIGSPKMLLPDLLQKMGIVIDAKSIQSCYVVADDWADKSHHAINNYATYAIFDDILEQDEKGCWSVVGMGRNVVIHIIYGNNNARGYVCLHIACQGLEDEDMYLFSRVSVLHKLPRTDDVNIYKLLLSFDAKDPQPILDTIEEIRSKAIEKNRAQEELTPQEASTLGFPVPFPTAFYSAQKRMDENRWGDAISDLATHYHIMKGILLRNEGDKEFTELFTRVCFLLSICYYSKGLNTKAAYYSGIAANYSDRSEPKDLYQRSLAQLHYPDENSKLPTIDGVYPLGVLLEPYFDMIPSELSALLWTDNQTQQWGEVNKQSAIWKFNIQDAMKDTDNLSLYISYRGNRAILDEEFVDIEGIRKHVAEHPNVTEEYMRGTTRACVDQSICQVDNVLVVHLTKERGVITLTAMVPRFKLSDNNNGGFPKVITFKFMDRPTATPEQYHEIRGQVFQKAEKNEELDELEECMLGTEDAAHVDYYNGAVAYEKKLWGDCIYYLSKAYNGLSGRWFAGKLDSKDSALMTTLCYKLGFAYSEVSLYEYSYYYLEILSASGHIPFLMEYINTLTNSVDPRAWAFVQSEYAKVRGGKAYQDAPEEWKQFYLAFLMRRKGHILIDLHRYEEAKAVFTSMLNVPGCRERALSELEYIKRCMAEEGEE